MSQAIRIESIVSQPFEENSYIVRLVDEPRCFVVDPGFEPDKILNRIREQQLVLEAILCTHGHVDHIAGNEAIKNAFPDAPLVIGAGDARMLTDPFLNLSGLGGVSVISPPADILVREGQTIDVIGLSWEVREIPGHSPGHVVYVWKAGSPPVVLGGDVIFAGGIGRVDFPGGDGQLLIAGIREKLYCLPDETVILPGHGPTTTVGDEKATNPFTSGRVFPSGW